MRDRPTLLISPLALDNPFMREHHLSPIPLDFSQELRQVIDEIETGIDSVPMVLTVEVLESIA
jgi:hypothetical protein